jgi:hypothetical protein
MSEIEEIEEYLRDTEIDPDSRFKFIKELPETRAEAKEMGYKNYYTPQQKSYFRSLVKVKVASGSPLTPILKNISKIHMRARRVLP